MNSRAKLNSKTLDEIKKELDPLCSYIIFRKEEATYRESDFSEILEILTELKIIDVDWQVFSDEPERRLLLVVKMKPQPNDLAIQETLACRLSRDIGFLFYKKWP